MASRKKYVAQVVKKRLLNPDQNNSLFIKHILNIKEMKQNQKNK